MSTIAEPTVEPEPTEKPSDGERAHAARKHIVRIVVVPGVKATSSRESHGPDQAHGLTAEELETGENILKEMPAPTPSDPTAKKQKNMFQALKPTDIVVMGVEAASVRVVDKHDNAVPLDESGQPVPRSTSDTRNSAVPNDSPRRKLFAHNDRLKDTVLRVWTHSDTVEYQCDREFKIVKVERANWNIHGAPRNPFEAKRGRTPYKAMEEKTADASGKPKSVWKWTSGVVPVSANNQQYKMTFRIFDERGKNPVDVDPDVVCGDPPPL
jgi:hypothetical protein